MSDKGILYGHLEGVCDGKVTIVVREGLLTIDADCPPDIAEEILCAAWVTQQERNCEQPPVANGGGA